MQFSQKGDIMTVKLDEKAISAIEAALNHGCNAEVRRKQDGVIVLEVQRKIKYSDLSNRG